jgi:hypothetical protein
MVELLVAKSSGGRWKYNMLLEAAPPDIDDTITIECELNKSSAVSFKLANQFKAYAEFKAYFTEASDPCFTMNPSKGTLEPYGKEGTPFFITYTPNTYGGAKSGKLIIETDDMYWSYNIRGIPPVYRPPEVSGGRLDNRLSRQTEHLLATQRTVASKNFIKDNIKDAKSQSPTKS